MFKNIAIIGVGKLGSEILHELISQKIKNILVVDKNEEILRNFVSKYDETITGISFDTTQKVFLEQNGINEMDVIIVAISNIRNSLVTCLNLIDLKVKRIIVRAVSNDHKRMLNKIGINEIVEADKIVSKYIIAKTLESIKKNFQIIDNNYISIKIRITNPNINNKSIENLKLETTNCYAIVYLIRNNKIKIPNNETELRINDEVIVVARKNFINDIIVLLEKID